MSSLAFTTKKITERLLSTPYELGKKIGEGAFGKVFLVKDKTDKSK
jgi:serine/threonine protein kinase